MSGKTFEIEIPVRFGDTDFAGILYFPKLFDYTHIAMEEFLGAAFGIPYHQLVGPERTGFPAVHTEADYRRPMPHGARLRLVVTVMKLGTTSVELRYRVINAEDGGLHAEARTTVVCIDMGSFEKKVLSPTMRRALEAYVEEV